MADFADGLVETAARLADNAVLRSNGFVDLIATVEAERFVESAGHAVPAEREGGDSYTHDGPEGRGGDGDEAKGGQSRGEDQRENAKPHSMDPADIHLAVR